MKRAIAEEHELLLEDDNQLSPKGGQQGFLDLSKAQDPIELGEAEENLGEYEPTEVAEEDAETAPLREEDGHEATYQDECTSSGDESREVREMRRLEKEEKRKRGKEKMRRQKPLKRKTRRRGFVDQRRLKKARERREARRSTRPTEY